jgi:hypothetical protein
MTNLHADYRLDTTTFYDRVEVAIAQPPPERHQQLALLHTEALHTYQSVLKQLSADDVQHPLPGHPDQRTIAEIIGHIAAWDRFALLSAVDILAGVYHPRMITDLSGYYDSDGQVLNFTTIDEFNAYHVHR